MKIINLASSSAGNCFVLDFGNKDIVLMECGIPYKKIINGLNEHGYTLNDIKYVFVSHDHKDHSKEVLRICKKDKVIIAPFDILENDELVMHKCEPLIKFKFKTLSFIAIPVKHGDMPNYAYIIESNNECVLFATDFSVIEYDLSNWKFTKVIIECNYLERLIPEKPDVKTQRQISTHIGLRGLVTHLENFDLSKCADIYLIHLSDAYSAEGSMSATISMMAPEIAVWIANKNGGWK